MATERRPRSWSCAACGDVSQLLLTVTLATLAESKLNMFLKHIYL